ncbi:MAG: TIGR01906 family membrane protein [Anaerolineales bacterium]|nr:TIGR01906 family membrane protein [Anaerolineales bacterium]
MNNDLFVKIVRWVVVIAIPFLLTVGTVRLLISWESPSYPEWEYGRIAPDQFGFTPEERLHYADATLAYLRRPESSAETIYLLEDLRLPGGDLPLYNEREIGHMVDVKDVADSFVTVFWVLFSIVVGGLIVLFLRPQTRRQGALALWHGGLLTVIIVIAVMVFIGVAWGVAFTLFHNLFFNSGTWTFYYSDSLIRLFPEQFWFDFGLLWTGTILVSGVILAVIGYLLKR